MKTANPSSIVSYVFIWLSPNQKPSVTSDEKATYVDAHLDFSPIDLLVQWRITTLISKAATSKDTLHSLSSHLTAPHINMAEPLKSDTDLKAPHSQIRVISLRKGRRIRVTMEPWGRWQGRWEAWVWVEMQRPPIARARKRTDMHTTTSSSLPLRRRPLAEHLKVNMGMRIPMHPSNWALATPTQAIRSRQP